MDQVFSYKNKTLKKYWKNGKKYWKSQGKVREFCQSRKVGTLFLICCYLHALRYVFCYEQVCVFTAEQWRCS